MTGTMTNAMYNTDAPDVLDDSDDDDQDSVMIALLPIMTDWCKIDIPHMTLVYAGLVKDLKPTDFNELAKDAASLAMLSGSISLRVSGVETFGDKEKVDVLKLRPTPEIMAMRRAVEDWNASEFSFSPHATIGPEGTVSSTMMPIPPMVAFNRIMVGWGNDNITFWLKNCGPSDY